jgi:5-carboxymethyl-2-hydroxymuconate isomerase
MPHLTLEISSNLAQLADPLLDAVTDTCQRSGHFAQAVLMSRVVVHERFRVRQQDMSAFANLTLRVRPGRSDAAKADLASQLAHSVQQVIEDAGQATPTCITCEIQEIDLRTRALILAGGA